MISLTTNTTSIQGIYLAFFIACLKVEKSVTLNVRGELSEWCAVRGVVSGISGLTIYLINNNTGDRYQVPIFFFY